MRSSKLLARQGPIAIAAIALLSLGASAQLAGAQARSHEQLAAESLEPPTIEILTMGPGALMVEKFGHAALCVRWPKLPGMDVCYNYGTTDFSAPLSMSWGFLRGNAEFWVEKWPRPRMLAHYRRKDRSLWAQVLDASNSSAQQRLEIARKLEFDARVENRHYTYHHFYDNCTTRVRDIVDQATGGKLGAQSQGYPGPTFREYGSMGFAEETWILAGADFALGRSFDKRASLWQAMFLPRLLRESIAETLGIEAKLLYARRGPPFPQSGSSGRGWTFLLALLLALPALLTRALRRRQRLGLLLSSLALGGLGLALWFAAVMSPLPALRYNEVLLLLVPTDLAIPWLRLARRQRYAQVRLAMIVLCSAAAAAGLLLQPLWIPVLVVFPTMLLVALPTAADRG